MILIGTSGSSKCDWQLIDNNKTFLSLSSNGINPYFHSEDIIEESVKAVKEFEQYKDQIEVVFFYGSGCSSKTLQNIVERGLYRVFTKSHLYVNHDIVAAAFATYGGTAALTCLMGTGANSCYFDGDIVRQEVPGVDYVLGDEGSGSYFGKILLQSYLRNKLPKAIKKDFEATYGININDILHHVYMEPFANVYLASFATFIEKHKAEPFFQEILLDGFDKYITEYVACYAEHQSAEVHFVGSIPFHFEEELKQALKARDIKLGKIIKEPIELLVKYHINKHYKS